MPQDGHFWLRTGQSEYENRRAEAGCNGWAVFGAERGNSILTPSISSSVVFLFHQAVSTFPFMRTLLATVLLCSIALSLSAQPAGKTQPADTPYEIISRSANSRVWQRTNWTQDASGEWVPQVHGYTELGAGICRKDSDGNYVDSSEAIALLPDGTAAATNCTTSVYLPADIGAGVIRLVTSDGKVLQNGPAYLAFDDGTNTVLIGAVTNSVGQLISSDQVLYPDIFRGAGFRADLLCTVRKSGFESDVVFREQIPDPASLGLGANARIVMLTEWFDTPEPVQTMNVAGGPDGLTDVTLRFGSTMVGRGRAFLTGTNSEFLSGPIQGSTPVFKSWIHTAKGQTFLAESVPYGRMASQLQQLPVAATTAAVAKPIKFSVRALPSRPRLQASTKGIQLAKMDISRGRRVVLDYVTLNSDQGSYTFQGDTTYLISSEFTITNIATFEGGAVLKYTNSGAVDLYLPPVFSTSPYRPVLFTDMNDNSVGETITGSSGHPSENSDNYLNCWIQDYSKTNTFRNARFTYAGAGIFFSGCVVDMWDCQFVQCGMAIDSEDGTVGPYWFHNSLFTGCGYAFYGYTDPGTILLTAENITVDGGPAVNADIMTASFTNCILNGGLGYTYGVDTINTNCTVISPSGPVFQSVGAGNYYLTNNSIYRNAGTTNITPALLAQLAQKTTYPPILYTNVVFSNNITLNPQAQRDYDTPDLGYHYDPIDYLVDEFWVTNATLVVTNGAVLAGYNDPDVLITDGSSIVSIGTPLAPNWFTRYSCVQEQPLNLGSVTVNGISVDPYHNISGPSGTFRFTKFSCPAGGGYHLYHGANNWGYGNLFVQDCEFWSGTNNVSGYTNTFLTLKNDLFARSGIYASVGDNRLTNNYLAASNNLFWNIGFSFHSGRNSNIWFLFNNDFDNCSMSGLATMNSVNGYNAYLVNTNRLLPTNAFDIVSTNDITYQTGPLGTFYQATNSILINAGSCTADQDGLFHYTTTTNEVIEGFSEVDIGYHYVATDTSGNPLDTNGDGTPDYLEDANGNGIWDVGIEPYDWKITGPDTSGAVNLQVYTPLN